MGEKFAVQDRNTTNKCTSKQQRNKILIIGDNHASVQEAAELNS